MNLIPRNIESTCRNDAGMSRKRNKQSIQGVDADVCNLVGAAENKRPDSAEVSPALDSNPPIALDKFVADSGLSPVTIWRYRRAGWLRTLNINGRHYVTRAEILRFNERAANGEFAKTLKPSVPNKCRPAP
jgi:hypothetical protein